jgi:hypothetical protein
MYGHGSYDLYTGRLLYINISERETNELILIFRINVEFV